MMRRMTVDAGHAALQMGRASIIALFVTALVAFQATGAGLLRCCVLEGEDFGFVAAAIDVLFPRAVTSLAAVPFGTFVRVELRVHGGGEVRRIGELCIDVFVASLAGIGTHVKSGVRRRGIRFGLFVGLVRGFALLCGTLFVARMGKRNYPCRNQYDQKRRDPEPLPILHRSSLPIGGKFLQRESHCIGFLSNYLRTPNGDPSRTAETCLQDSSSWALQEDNGLFEKLSRRGMYFEGLLLSPRGFPSSA